MGGSKPQPAQIIPAPPPPQGGTGGGYQQSAGEVAQAQLQYNPQLAAQYYQLQAQYAPQYSQLEYQNAAQYGPMYKALTEQLFPQVGQLENITTQQLGSPTYLTPEQQAAQDTVRNREQERFLKGVRSQANLGGTLYGGNQQQLEQQGLAELSNQYALSDIGLQQQQQQQAMSNLALLFQLAFPNVQQPNVAHPSIGGDPNALYNSLIQNQGNFGIIPGQQGSPSPWWGIGGAAAGGAAAAATAAAIAA